VKGICKIRLKGWVRLAYISGLTFFVCLFGCRSETRDRPFDIQWKNEQAVAVSIPSSFAADIPDDSASSLITINLSGQRNPIPILGSLERKNGDFLFTPLIPFTGGIRYDVRVRGTRAGGFEIPENNAGSAPSVTAIYPSGDTLPENLLKIYLHFDQPMREGVSGRYVKLVENGRDTIDGAFLDLQPELWNPERTVLTLWLDPGRIKRDLQPNRRLGAPMRHGTHYRIVVARAWTDARGQQLTKSYQKAFVTAAKDSLSPRPSRWTLVPPLPATRQPLKIDFKEALDHSLLAEVFEIQSITGAKIPGQWETGRLEKQCSFVPDANWQPGDYKLLIEPRLEDLAGNNLARPFDRDVSKEPEAFKSDIATLPFQIK